VGFVLAFLIAIVIIGGIQRIGEVTSLMVPAMCGFYCIVCLVIILANVGQVPAMFASIFQEAFTAKAGWGALVGVIIQGVQRASFSNEAGMGSAAIAHSAARTDDPVHEGVVGLVEPFIDTHLVCTMTSLAILVTGAHLQDLQGIEVTAYAFGTLGAVLPKLLAVAACVFAYSTAISWSYYGERAVEYLFGYGLPTRIYKIVFVLCAFIAPAVSIVEVLNFSDTMLLGMAIPNAIGMLALSKELREMTMSYLRRLKSGEMKEYVRE
jgi:AGCS family alanine or glycine:cation symporter